MADHPTPHPDLAGYVLGALAPQEAQEFERHLAGCAACRAEVTELRNVPELLRAEAEEAPPQLRERTFAAIDRAARASYPPPIFVRVVDRIRAVRRRPLIVAATLVLVALLGAVVLTGRDEGARQVTVPLAAAASGERGSGKAVISRSPEGLEIRLSVSGLKPNAPGTYYECWYVGAADSAGKPERISGGTFTVREDGTADVALTTAADYAKYPAVAVTLESDDGDPATTGQVVLVSQPRRRH